MVLVGQRVAPETFHLLVPAAECAQESNRRLKAREHEMPLVDADRVVRQTDRVGGADRIGARPPRPKSRSADQV